MNDLEQISQKFRELVVLGVCIVIDDFGIGYLFLNYFYWLLIYIFKVDQFFVKVICGGDDGVCIVNVIVVMVYGLKLEIVVEGVEIDE